MAILIKKAQKKKFIYNISLDTNSLAYIRNLLLFKCKEK